MNKINLFDSPPPEPTTSPAPLPVANVAKTLEHPIYPHCHLADRGNITWLMHLASIYLHQMTIVMGNDRIAPEIRRSLINDLHRHRQGTLAYAKKIGAYH